jgi:hypothetical protein
MRGTTVLKLDQQKIDFLNLPKNKVYYC